ncbi:MAG: DUF3793 family protein [Planctomycetes bacterium]|nr:DUF3793 family protein [Planctomycetota bacterium]
MQGSLPEASQNILTLMSRLRGMSDCDYVQNLVAYHAAPTILGLKPATLICPGATGRNLRSALAECGDRLSRELGISIEICRNHAGALLLLVYNPARLQTALAAREVMELLADAGYAESGGDLEPLLAQLRKKCAEPAFPHEIGVFLGYPAKDVRHFMRAGCGRSCRKPGCWRSFGDDSCVDSLSRRYRRAKMRAAELIVRGTALAAMATGLREAV